MNLLREMGAAIVLALRRFLAIARRPVAWAASTAVVAYMFITLEYAAGFGVWLLPWTLLGLAAGVWFYDTATGVVARK